MTGSFEVLRIAVSVCVLQLSQLKSLRVVGSSAVSSVIWQETRAVVLDKFVIQSVTGSRWGNDGIDFSYHCNWFFQSGGKILWNCKFQQTSFCICLEFGKNFLSSRTATEIVLMKLQGFLTYVFCAETEEWKNYKYCELCTLLQS